MTSRRCLQSTGLAVKNLSKKDWDDVIDVNLTVCHGTLSGSLLLSNYHRMRVREKELDFLGFLDLKTAKIRW